MKILTVCSTLFLAVAMAGCITATVTEPAACDSKGVSFDLSGAMAQAESQLPSGATINSVCADGGASPSNTVQFPPLTTTTDFDFSGDLNKIDDVAKDVQVSVTKLMLNTSGVLLLSHVEVDIQGTDTFTFPNVMLATWDPGTSPDAQIKMASPALLSYLESGDVTLTFTLDSNPIDVPQLCTLVNLSSFDGSATMCVKASGTFSK